MESPVGYPVDHYDRESRRAGAGPLRQLSRERAAPPPCCDHRADRTCMMPAIGLFVPTAAPDATPGMAVPFGQRAEAAGLASVWLPDRPVFANPDPLVALATVAATTSRVQLGTCVLLGTLRPPALLAKSVASLDAISGGRVILGLGVGSRADDFAAAGVPFAGRGARA